MYGFKCDFPLYSPSISCSNPLIKSSSSSAASPMASASITGGHLLLSSASLLLRRRANLIVSSSSPSIPFPSPLRASPNLRTHLFSSILHCSSQSAVETTDSSPETASPPPPPPPPPPSDAAVKEAADVLDIRVGRILKAWRHPEADSLYVEEVDVGEEEPRTICSGLVNYIPLEHLQDAKVVVLANLKPRNMRGVKSNGMLMAASDESHENVELLLPAEGSVPGERIWFGSEDEKDKQPDAVTPNQVQKKKIWELVQPRLKTTDTCIAVLCDHPMQTSAGPVTSRSLKNARIS